MESGLLPVVQPAKNKVRLMLDFGEMNSHGMWHLDDKVTEVCGGDVACTETVT